MDAPFEVGDLVVAVQPRPGIVQGHLYTITNVQWEEDWFVTVEGYVGNLYASRFELVGSQTITTPVIRKIKQLETRFQQRVAR